LVHLGISLGVVGVQAEVHQCAVVAPFSQLLGEEGTSLQQYEVDEPPVRALTQCIGVGTLAKVVKAACAGVVKCISLGELFEYVSLPKVLCATCAGTLLATSVAFYGLRTGGAHQPNALTSQSFSYKT